MSNWCDGNIRIRGTYDRIVKVFSENLLALKRNEKRDYDDIPVKVQRSGDFCTLIMKPEDECEKEFWFKGSSRQFMKTEAIELIDFSDDEFQEICICVEGFHGAWNVDLVCFQELAKNYGVDIKIIGYDRGLEFCETVEFYRDGRVLDKSERFNDWDWECPRPNLGG